MDTNNFVYCVMNKTKCVAIYNNINYAMKEITSDKKCIIKPFLLNSKLDFEEINFNPNTNNFYNSKQFFYLDHQYINIKNNKLKEEENITDNNINDVVEEDNSLNLFIPLGKDDEEEYYPVENKVETDINNLKLSKTELLEKLRQKISNLKNLKEIEENDLNKMETMMDNKKDNFEKNKIKFNKIKKLQDDKKEKYESLKRKFSSDKNTYFKMKEDISNDILKEIPDLFKIKYSILEKMDNDNELNLENSLNIYLERIPYVHEAFTIEDEQLIGIFGEYYIEDNDSSKDSTNDDEDITDFDSDED